MEQCALLVYLLRQAGVPATYVFPTNSGLKMLDVQLSKLLRFQVKGALSRDGQTNLPTLIGVNYPWVAAYVGTNWVQIFPWLKDTEVIEGLDLYDYMPTNYNTGHKWLERFVQNDTNIMSLSESDQPMDLFPKFIEKQLNQNFPGLSLDDIGVKYLDRRNLYSRWSDFPKPFQLSGTPLVKESLTNDLSLFNTIQIRVYSQANTNKSIDTGELRIADLHNRKLQLKFLQVGTQNVHDMILSLDSYQSAVTNTAAFTTNANVTYRLIQTNQLNSTDDLIKYQVTHKRICSLPANYVAPSSFSNLWEYLYFEQGAEKKFGLTYEKSETFRKGDLITFCLDVGRVSQKMLNVHAETIWQHNRTATNSSLTNPDIYQGTVAYLAGMSYWEYYDRFDEMNSRLHKIHMLANYGYGFSMLRPQRDTSGALVSSGVVNLVEPVIHVPQNGGADVFNGTLRPDSGRDYPSAHWDWFMVHAAQGSAAEHGILRSFYNTNAISTVKLLQLSGTNFVNLNKNNYLTEGEVTYNGKKLKLHDSGVWTSVTNHFNTSAYQDYYKQVLMTQGTMTNGTYIGSGAFMISFNLFEAAISGLLNGGNSSQLPATTLSTANSPNITLALNPDGSVSPFRFISTPPNSGDLLISSATTSWNQQQYYNALSGNQANLDPTLLQATILMNQLNGSYGNNQYEGYRLLNDVGTLGKSDWFEDSLGFLADPVNAVSGEFYVDAVDLSLPGPMPLQIRRNYSSHNLAENQFGFGWKLSYMPFLSVSTNGALIYAAETEGSVIAYEQTATNANVWLPNAARNPNLSNKGDSGIGSTANPFKGRIERTTVSGTNNYTLFGADGGKRIFVERSFPIGASFTRLRPYLAKWEDNRGNFYTFEYGVDSTKPDYGEVRRIQSSNGSFLGFYYDVYGHVIEAYTGDGRRLFYEYDKYGDLVSVTRPDASQFDYEYQHSNYVTNSVTNVYSLHLITRENKPDGRVLVNEFDAQRRVTNQLATVGVDLVPVRNATFVYSNNFVFTNSVTNLVTGFTVIKDIFNNTNQYEYTNNLITRIIDSLGQTNEQYWYADNATAPGYARSLWKTKDKRGLLSEFKYDANGNITNTVVTGDLTGDGVTSQTATNLMAYNALNLPTEITDPAGNRLVTLYHTQYPYLPEYVIRYGGATPIRTNKMTYYNVTNTFVSGGITYTNLAFGLIQQEVRAFGSTDAATNLWFHDGRGFVTQSVGFTRTSDPAITNSFVYNDRNELVERTDAAGRRATFAYDAMGRSSHREVFETGQTIPLSWESSYYNPNGELTWSDGPRYNPEDYVWRDYDGAGRNTTEIRWRSQAKADGTGVEAPSGYDLFAQSFSEHDGFGNLKRTIDPRGAVVTNTWDALGQLVQRKFYDHYDPTVLLSSEGFAYEPGGQVRYQTNALGGLTENQYTTTGQPKFRKSADGSTNAWRYYLDGRLYREFQRNGAYWQTTYDDANRKTTRVFYSAGVTPLATNIVELDRRGNLVKRTDAGGFVFTNLFDGLDRLKVSAGPPVVTVSEVCTIPFCGNYVTNILQQKTTYFYDAAGVVTTNVNALGEKSITISDALGRPLVVEIRNTNNTLIRVTRTAYSADHHSATVTNGSGASAILSTTYTDNDGRNLLSVAYPSANVREFTLWTYDLAGLPQYEDRYVATNSAANWLTFKNYIYDGLNRLIATADRDFAITYYDYNSLGNLTNRLMPGGLQWQARYNNAGLMLEEKNVGSGSAATRTNTYAYYAAGSPFVGLLQTSTDGRGVACTHTYDDWLRPSYNSYDGPLPEHDIYTSMTYDARGLMTMLVEASTGFSLENNIVSRDFDANGQMLAETVIAGGVYSGVTQTWDAAGRRRQLGFGGLASFAYNYSWRADGSLESVATPVGGGSYNYNAAGVLTNRNVGSRSTTIASLDGMGRPLSITNKVSLITKLSETLSWTGDGLLNTHTLDRVGDFTDSRAYSYADFTRRLTEERLNLDGSKRWTNSFTYDNGVDSGPGALTMISPASGTARWTGGTDAFSRINTETNSTIRRPASGKVNGPATVTASLDGMPQPISVYSVNDATWTNRWTSTLEVPPGAHQLIVSAQHPSGKFTTNASVWFTNSVASERITDSFDGAGYLTKRIWKSPSGTTNRTQDLSWDARGRLVKVIERDSSTNGFDWLAFYDPQGRRMMTRTFPVTNGVEIIDSVKILIPFFDPMVEFLEMGVMVNYAQTQWKMYGPDLNGVYGGLNGTGGFDAVAPGLNVFNPTLSDARGNILGVVTNGIAVNWTGARPTGYGAASSYKPLAIGFGGDVATSAAWRGRAVDITGFVNLGARHYIPDSGSFLGSDPVWNDRDPNYYSFASGDPINYFDPDGRLVANAGKKLVTGLMQASSDAYHLERMDYASQGAAINRLFGNDQSAQMYQDMANESSAYTLMRGQQFADEYQASYEFYGNSHLLALNAHFNPAVEAGLSGMETFGGTGYHSYNSGLTLDYNQRVDAGGNFLLSGVQTIAVAVAFEQMGTGFYSTPKLNPTDINFSQRTVNSNVRQYADDMAAGEWDWSQSGPVRVMNRDGQWVSYDNRRVMAAQQAGLAEVPVQVVQPNTLMPGSSLTWDQAFVRRFNDSRNVQAGGVVPNSGLSTQPAIATPRK